MHFYSNHCWCSKSNWNNNTYAARYKITIESHPEILGLDFFKDKPCNDYKSLIHEKEVLDKEDYEHYMNSVGHKYSEEEKEEIKETFLRDVPFLNENVIKWLNENVEDNNKYEPEQVSKGWCIGNDDCRERESIDGVSIWFQTRSDAMNFVKQFSEYKKPLTYYDYFKDKKKYLDIKTGKYIQGDFEDVYEKGLTP